MKTKLVFTVIAIFTSVFCLTAQVDKIAEMMDGLDMPENYRGFIDERYLISNETDLTFKLNIYLPVAYNESKDNYPIMILTDAYWYTGIAQSTFDLLTFYKEVPEVIVVGIDYPYSNMMQLVRNRYRDMTPTHVEGYDPSGEADKFIAFIEKELLPFIVNNYRADSTDRCFYGHSIGGLLGSHILIEKPYLFNRYIIGSPSYYWDNREIINRIQNKDSIGGQSNIVIYSFMGSKEGDWYLADWDNFNSYLIKKIKSNTKFHEQIYENESHASVTLAAFPTAVKFIYGSVGQ